MSLRRVNGATVRVFRQHIAKQRQDEFALRMGVTPSYQNHIEAGRKQPSPQYTAKLAEIFGESVDAFSCTCAARHSESA